MKDEFSHFALGQVVGGGMIATIASSMLCMSLPYEAGVNAKHLAWLGENSLQCTCSYGFVSLYNYMCVCVCVCFVFYFSQLS